MPKKPDKVTPADPAPAPNPPAGTPVPVGKGEEEEPFPYSLQIGDVYDGPLDVLLMLIKKQNLNIYDLPMAKITAQFQAYSRTIPVEEVDRAIEFVHMASQLIYIKSRMLLPFERPLDGTLPDDPRKSLVERLLEYDQVKQAAAMLRNRQWAEESRWTNPGNREFRDDSREPEPQPSQPDDSTDLEKAFQQIMERAANRPSMTIANEKVTVAQMFSILRDSLRLEDAPISFEDAIAGSASPRIITAAFLAVLEMVRVGAVFLKQERQGGAILIKKSPSFEESMTMAGSFDQWT